MAILKDGITVGHVPQKISSICSLFLRRHKLIQCEITGRRRYSRDLPQGDLEVPCTLTFEGNSSDVTKAAKLVKDMEKPEGHDEVDRTADLHVNTEVGSEAGHLTDDEKSGESIILSEVEELPPVVKKRKVVVDSREDQVE